MALTWMGTQLWQTPDPPARFMETTVPGEAAAVVAEELLPVLTRDLGLGAVKIRWFKPETAERRAYRESTGSTAWHNFEGEEGLKGQCRGAEPGVVWIRADLGALDAAETLGHELQHSKHDADYIAGAAEMPDDDEGEEQVARLRRALDEDNARIEQERRERREATKPLRRGQP